MQKSTKVIILLYRKKNVNKFLHKLAYANIKVKKYDKTEEFITKLLFRKHGSIEVVLPKFVRKVLNLNVGNIIEILEIKRINSVVTKTKMINRNKVDLISLLPKNMSNNKKIFMNYNNGI